jgi:hypothetical protein
MNLIIHHETAWLSACQKYNIQIDTPNSWPVVANFIVPADSSAVSIVSIMTVEMAAKFLSTCTPERVSKIDPATRNKVAALTMSYKTGIVLDSQIKPKPLTMYKVNDVIKINGTTMVVTENGIQSEGQVQAEDPIIGVDTLLDVAEEQMPDKGIPGLEEIPMDPSKLDPEKNIADLGDPTEHVLDVERSV